MVNRLLHERSEHAAFEPVGVPDRPRRHETAVRAAQDAQAIRVHPVKATGPLFYAGHKVVEIDAPQPDPGSTSASGQRTARPHASE